MYAARKRAFARIVGKERLTTAKPPASSAAKSTIERDANETQSKGDRYEKPKCARESIEQESKSDTGFKEFLAKIIQKSINGGTKHNG